MPYIEGFVAAVPTANKDEYVKHAREASQYFKDLGATRVIECWGDDVPRARSPISTRQPGRRTTNSRSPSLRSSRAQSASSGPRGPDCR